MNLKTNLRLSSFSVQPRTIVKVFFGVGQKNQDTPSRVLKMRGRFWGGSDSAKALDPVAVIADFVAGAADRVEVRVQHVAAVSLSGVGLVRFGERQHDFGHRALPAGDVFAEGAHLRVRGEAALSVRTGVAEEFDDLFGTDLRGLFEVGVVHEDRELVEDRRVVERAGEVVRVQV